MRAGAILLIACGLQAQAPKPAFEVASVRPAGPTAAGSGSRSTRDGIDFPGATLAYCIGFAYKVKPYQISGPAWLSDNRYDIAAKGPAGTNPKQLEEMLQSLLAERFDLKIHKEPRDFRGFALVVEKGGPKLPVNPTTFGALRVGSWRLWAEGVGMAQLAGQLSLSLGHPVIDMTQLTAKYDFSLEWSREDALDRIGYFSQAAPTPQENEVSIDTSLDALGLKLQPRKVPLDVIVVDHADKTPTEN